EPARVHDDLGPAFVQLGLEIQDRQGRLDRDRQHHLVGDLQPLSAAETLAGQQPRHAPAQRILFLGAQAREKAVLHECERPQLRVDRRQLALDPRAARALAQQPTQHTDSASVPLPPAQMGQATEARAANGPASRIASICPRSRTYSTPPNDSAFSDTSAKCSLLRGTTSIQPSSTSMLEGGRLPCASGANCNV